LNATKQKTRSFAKSQISASQVGFRKRNFQKTDPLIYSTCLLSAYRLLWIKKIIKGKLRIKSEHKLAEIASFMQLLT